MKECCYETFQNVLTQSPQQKKLEITTEVTFHNNELTGNKQKCSLNQGKNCN